MCTEELYQSDLLIINSRVRENTLELKKMSNIESKRNLNVFLEIDLN